MKRMGLLAAILVILLTITFGRAWCGWICPMGTLLEWFSFKQDRKRAANLPRDLRRVKTIVLAYIASRLRRSWQ